MRLLPEPAICGVGVARTARPDVNEARERLMNRVVGALLLAATAALVVAQAHIP